jgi:hypothetical protein
VVNVFATVAGEISSAYDRAEVIAVMEMAAAAKRHFEIDMQLPQKVLRELIVISFLGQ